MKLLHFADAHIDMSNYGRHDPESGLPLRVLDFLKSLDTIVETAISEKVDLVIFAGDAYKDRAPSPTFQREWGKRIMRLSQAQIPTLLLIGNHDVSPSIGRAHALQEFKTLQAPFVHVSDEPEFLAPPDLWNLPAQVIALPWVTRSGLMAFSGETDAGEAYLHIENIFDQLIQGWLEEKYNPALPLILTAHASVEGASFGGERLVMLGNDLALSGSLVKNKKFNYVALGHIHKPQNLNEGAQPPVIYPGSIERVDFGEAKEERFFIMAEIQAGGETKVEWRKLQTRPFIDRRVVLQSTENITAALKSALPSSKQMKDAIVRLVVEYPREWDTLIDEPALQKFTEGAFEFHLAKRPQMEARARLPQGQLVSSLSPLELLEQYWLSAKVNEDTDALKQMARKVIQGEDE